MRRYCRFDRCRSKFAEPVDNERRAFCTPGCHASFYKRRCLVCEREFAPKARGAPQRLCKSAKCRAEYRRFPHAYTFGNASVAPTTGIAEKGLETPIKSAPETPVWRVIAGPQLSPAALRLATLPLDPATEARVHRANARVWDEAAIIGPKDAPINLIGGYRFPNAPPCRACRGWRAISPA
jgi:hypothetical protein